MAAADGDATTPPRAQYVQPWMLVWGRRNPRGARIAVKYDPGKMVG
jgi:hypothetical protein